MVEAYAAGPAAQEIVAGAVANLEALTSFVFEQMPDRAGMPTEMIAGMVGSVRKVIHTRLHRRTEKELVGMVPELVALALTYEAPPQTLKTRAHPGGGRRAVRGADIGHDAGDRIEAATMSVVAEHGWLRRRSIGSPPRLVPHSAPSTPTSTNKAAAFEAAVYRHRLQMTAVALRSLPPGPQLAGGDPGLVYACLAYLERRATLPGWQPVVVWAAGATALEVRGTMIEATERYVAEGELYAPIGKPLAPEAIFGAVYSMVSERVRQGGTKNLRSLAPLATYVALAPYLGSEEAAAVASGEEPNDASGTTENREKRLGGDGSVEAKEDRGGPEGLDVASSEPCGDPVANLDDPTKRLLVHLRQLPPAFFVHIKRHPGDAGLGLLQRAPAWLGD